MRRIALVLIVAFSASTGAQSPAIELRRLWTMVDHDGRGFSRHPSYVTALSGGRFILTEDKATGTRPVVIDSTGRFLRFLANRGQGPGEFPDWAGPFRVGKGDTVFAGNNGNLTVLDANLKHVRTIRPSGAVGEFFLTDDGFLAQMRSPAQGGGWTPFHYTDEELKPLKSMGHVAPGRQVSDGFRLAPAVDGFWANKIHTHRFERWTRSGATTIVIDNQPSWFYQLHADRPAPFSTVKALREIDGNLWAMNLVPSPRIAQIVQEATGRTSRPDDGDGPPLPMERMYTTVLEVYDGKTGRLLAERKLDALAVAFLDDRRFVIYSVNSADLPQLEIWEMKLKP